MCYIGRNSKNDYDYHSNLTAVKCLLAFVIAIIENVADKVHKNKLAYNETDNL